jgi:predicted acylesterase/phospholipase RssA
MAGASTNWPVIRGKRSRQGPRATNREDDAVSEVFREGSGTAAFKIGINMAGAVSAGAYTAGVLDFLTEALDEWYKAKGRGELVPAHDVSIEVLSGASAGGMCAAISAVMLNEDFEHVHDTKERDKPTTNRFYESWVNKIDIHQLLKTDDLKPNAPVESLLDSTIISQIASYALTPGVPLSPPRPYVSPNLTLFLSLTNLRGVPYSLNGAAPGSVEETTLFFGDRIRFEMQRPDKISKPAQNAHILDLSKAGAAGGWDVLQTAAMATGAFPAFLAPRELKRNTAEYIPPMWESVTAAATGTPPPTAPNFPPNMIQPFATLNVDGGITNNDPFHYSHDYLASLPPASPNNINPMSAEEADRAVINIAPFPTTAKFSATFAMEKQAGVLSVLPKLFSALISQSRFFGESLSDIMSGNTFSRFVIAPSDDRLAKKYQGATGHPVAAQPPALQCAVLSAFGGFFERGFRAHDYALGRRNCQRFLETRFLLPENNVVMKAALEGMDAAAREEVLNKYARRPPGDYAGFDQMSADESPAAQKWLPIIPLCTDSVAQPLPPIPRAQISGAALNEIVELILKRFRAIMPLFIDRIPSWAFRSFLKIGQPIIAHLAKKPLTDALIKELGDSYKA